MLIDSNYYWLFKVDKIIYSEPVVPRTFNSFMTEVFII